MIREMLARAFIKEYSGNTKWEGNEWCFAETFYKEADLFGCMMDKASEEYPNEFANFDRTKNVQEQLQEMVMSRSFWWQKDNAYAYFDFLQGFLTFAVKELKFNQCYTRTYLERFRSMSQAFLAFYMEECHHRRWDGEKWVEERYIKV